MKLFITHANIRYDKKKVAKKGIEEILTYFKPEDIVELDSTFGEGKRNDSKKYTKHKGTVIYSQNGFISLNFPDFRYCMDDMENLIEKLSQWNDKEFVLTGGYFGLCHGNTFEALFRNYKGRVFIFPLEGIFYKVQHLEGLLTKNLNYDYITKTIIERYCSKAKIYWDDKLVKNGNDNCTIKVFSENKLLYSLLKPN